MRSTVIILLVLGMVGCAGQGPRKPMNLPGKEAFTALLTDLQLADAWVSQKRAEGEDIKVLSEKMYDSVFLHHQISRKEFEESMAWYAANLTELDAVYDEVIHRLAMMQTRDTIP